MRLSDLECGDLFIWSNEANKLHQMIGMVDGLLMAAHVATKIEGAWRFYEPLPKHWDPRRFITPVDIKQI